MPDHAPERGIHESTIIKDDIETPSRSIYRPVFETLFEAACKGKAGAVYRGFNIVSRRLEVTYTAGLLCPR